MVSQGVHVAPEGVNHQGMNCIHTITGHGNESPLKHDHELWDGRNYSMQNCKGKGLNANMKVSEQCRIAAYRGNRVIGMIQGNIT